MRTGWNADGRGHTWAPHGTANLPHQLLSTPPGTRMHVQEQTRTHLRQACWMVHAASFLLVCCSLSESLCARVGVCVAARACVWLEEILWSRVERHLAAGVRVWSLVVAFAEVHSLLCLCFCGDAWASALPRAVCTVACRSLLFRGVRCVEVASVWSTVAMLVEGVHVFEEGWLFALGREGGPCLGRGV